MRKTIYCLWGLLLMTMSITTSADTISSFAVRHIVVFKYSDDATDADIEKVSAAFRALQHKIPGIVSFEDGVNNSPENLNKGLTHVYQVTFENEAARNAYLPHVEHKKFGALLGELGIVDDVFVVDYHP